MILSTLQCCSDHKTFSFIPLSIHNRVPGFLSSRPNWLPSPTPQASVATPLVPKGEVGGALWYSIGIVHIIPLRFFSSHSSQAGKTFVISISLKYIIYPKDRIFAALPTCLYCPLCTVCTVWWLHCCEDKYLSI
jgi:hypothetical protein